MKAEEQIENHINSIPPPKQAEMRELHQLILKIVPDVELWFDNGVNAEGKVVTNPTIGYGLQTITYANGSSKPFFRIGLCANTTGFSVYVLGLKDKGYLNQTYGSTLGKAKITGYCIKFKTIKDIKLSALEEAVKYGLEQPNDV